MGITFVTSLRDAGLKLLSNLTSYKLWMFAVATWLLSQDMISEWLWFVGFCLIISERFAEKVLGAGFFGRIAARSKPAAKIELE
jgi:hypothetical protein